MRPSLLQALLLAGPAAIGGCGPRLVRPAPEPGFDPARARAEVEWLADPARTGRGVGTPGGAAAAAWVAERLAETGLRPAYDPGYLQTFEVPARAPRSGAAGEPRREPLVTANVAAVLPGRDPAVAGECVVGGGHHDHLGHGGEGSLAPDRLGTIHPGADDDASGVAALLAVARWMAEAGPGRRTVVFAAFGAEELGLLGSRAFVERPPPGCPVERMQLMVNLDTVGRPTGGRLYVLGTGPARGLRGLVADLARRAPALPLHLAFGEEGHSDHLSFAARGIATAFLFGGPHADYHRPTDTAEKVDPARLMDVARLAGRLAREAADRDGRLEVVRTAAPPTPPAGERDRGYGAYLGAVPDFAERSEPGVLLSGVRPGSPAERAGLAAGDVLLRVGATRLASLKDLAHALRSHRPGDEVELEWVREGRRLTGEVRLDERK